MTAARTLFASLTTLLLLAPALTVAAAPSTDERVQQTAAWLIAQRDGTGLVPGPGGGPDHGLTVDVVLGWYAAGQGQQAAAATTDALEATVADYAGPGFYPEPGTRLAAGTSKLLFVAAVTGRDPADFGGRDLRGDTLALVVDDPGGPTHGRVRDHVVSQPRRDDSNAYTQSMAVLGLARTGGVPEEVVNYLDSYQCSEGFFRIFATDAATNPGLTCDGGKAAGNAAPDVDATAVGVQAMMAARDQGLAGLDDDITSGLDYLESAQRKDGSFGGGVATSGSNTNSTGLAAQALSAGGRGAAAAAASAHVATLHVSPEVAEGSGLSGEVGAIAYDDAALQGGLASGITGRDQWRRATPQAVLALTPVPMGRLGDGGLDPDPPPAPSPSPAPTPSPSPSPTPSDPTPSPSPSRTPSDPTPSPTPSDPAPSPTPSDPTPSPTTSAPGQATGESPPAATSTTGPPPPADDGWSRAPRPPATGAGDPADPGSPARPGSTGAAPAPTSSDPAARAVAWLRSQLVDGTHLRTERNGTAYIDHAATAQAWLAMRMSGASVDDLADLTGFLSAPEQVDALAHGAPHDADDAAYVSGLADLVLVAAFSQGEVDGHDIGGTDAVAELRERQQEDGWFTDVSDVGDQSDTSSQAGAVLALTAVGETEAAAAGVAPLVALQCADGSFPEQREEACTEGDLTATAAAVQALAAAPAGDQGQLAPSVQQALSSAIGALLSERAEDGGLSTPGETGQVAGAFLATGQDGAVDRARAWLVDQQTGEGGLPARADGEAPHVAATVDALPALAATSVLTLEDGPLRPAVDQVAPAGSDGGDDASATGVDGDASASAPTHEDAAGEPATWLLAGGGVALASAAFLLGRASARRPTGAATGASA